MNAQQIIVNYTDKELLIDNIVHNTIMRIIRQEKSKLYIEIRENRRYY